MTPAEVLTFERTWWRHAANKAETIRERFGLTLEEYDQRLDEVLDSSEALAIDAALVKRLRRLRDKRARGTARLASKGF